MSEENIKNLLESVNDAINSWENNQKVKENHGETFNVFSLCGVDHYEIWHSKILAEFLNPRGMHGQTDAAFLKAFFKIINNKINKKSEDCLFDEWTYVRSEESAKLGELNIGRFDVYLENYKKKVICVIENKIFAGEQPTQLERYSNWLEDKEGYTTYLIFLTLDGHESSTINDKKKYIQLAYKDDILPWLQECRQIACDKPFVRETLGQYQYHLEKIINGGQIMDENIVKLLDKGTDLKAAQLIYENYCSARDKKARDLFNKFETFFEKFSQEKSLQYEVKWNDDLDSAHQDKGYCLTVNKGEESVNVSICFQCTGLKSLYIGVCSDMNSDLDLSNLYLGVLNNENPNSKIEWDSPNKAWPLWRYIGVDKNNGIDYSSWDGNFLAEMEKDEFKKKYFNEMANTIEAICKIIFKV